MKAYLLCLTLSFITVSSGLSQDVATSGRNQMPLLYFTKTSKPTLADNFFMDRDSFIWFLTDAGFVRYNGRDLKEIVSDPFNLNSLSSNRIKDAAQDGDGIFWIATRGGGLNSFDPKTGKFIHYRHDPTDSSTLSTDDLFSLQFDETGKLWIGSTLGMNQFDPLTGKNIRMLPEPGTAGRLQGNPMSPIVITPERVYVCTTAGFEFYDRKRKRWHFFPTVDARGDTIRFDMEGVFSALRNLVLDRNGLLWIGVPKHEGLWVFDPKTNRYAPFNLQTPTGKRIPVVRAVLEDHAGRLWAASDDHIWRISPDRQSLEQCLPVKVENRQPLTNIITLYEGYDGLIWMRADQEQNPLFFDPNQEAGKIIRLPLVNNQPLQVEHILFDTDGTVWLSTNDGVIRCNPATGEASYVFREPYCYHLNLLGNDHLLISCQPGLMIFEKKSGRYFPVRLGSAQAKPVTSPICSAFDLDGDLWYSAWGSGLIHIPSGALDIRTGIASRFKQWKYDPVNPYSLPSNLLQGIAVDANNKVWVCGAENGLNSVDKTTGTVQRFMYKQGNEHGIVTNYTFALGMDSGGDIWLTLGRPLVHRFSSKTGQFKKYDTADGFPNYRISEMAVDKTGNIWFNQTIAVSSINPATGQVAIFPQVAATALLNQAIAVHPTTGDVYFGCQDELRTFNPATFNSLNVHPSPLRLSKVSYYDGKKTRTMLPLPENSWKTNTLQLSYLENSLEIEFALLDYRSPFSHVYAYSLTKKGDQPQWIPIGDHNSVSFSNMAPGTYHFSVKGRNSYGIWTEQTGVLKFVISPPWWATWWAYLLYALAIGAIVGVFYRYRLHQKLDRQETLRLRELDEFKNRLFTNITHEFRTPLTVILGNLEIENLEIEKLLAPLEEKPDDTKISTHWDKQFLNFLISKNALTRRSAESLLRLINQILDLAKLESKTLKLNYVRGDVLSYLRYIAESLHSLANAQNVMIRVESKEQEILMDYDPERLLQIVHNLMSNAIKFTPSGGQVTLSIGMGGGGRGMKSGVTSSLIPHSSSLLLSVTDTGAGIPADDLPYIFDRFFQANNYEKAKAGLTGTGGTGIGLALTKELVKAMGGDISVESEVGKGTTFTIKLPITKMATASDGVTSSHPITSEVGIRGLCHDDNHPAIQPSSQLLIIEDNPDVVEYLAACLQAPLSGSRGGAPYQLDFAYNGKAGIEKAVETIPDLIISDVMMPEKDGFEVCETLKNDERTSHIPIVLLTAKAGVENRIAGLKRGADAYLAKPFHREELLVTLSNLLELRKKLQAKYSDFGFRISDFGATQNSTEIRNPKSEIPKSEIEDVFVQKVRTAIFKRLSDSTLSVEDLSRSLSLSQRQLHRKLTALTGKNAGQFIRSIRLARAKELLLSKEKNVSEVAYETGFDDPKYFSRIFTEEFGIPPSQI